MGSRLRLRPPSAAPGRPARLCAVLLLAGGCAGAAVAPPAPAPAEVAGFEARVARDSADVPALLALGRAYQVAGRAEAAIPLLERARRLQPGDPDASLLLGLAYEDRGRLADAEASYGAYLGARATPALKRRVTGRLVLLRRRAFTEAARQALQREGELAATPPRPRTVAVFPFLFQASDSTLRPLSLALADLLVTDLSQTDRLTVLERLRVQELVDEAGLADAGVVDPATAARGGRLLGAERVVQGSIGGTEAAVQLQAAVLPVATGVVPGGAPVQEAGALRAVIDMQKRLALGLYAAMGIELTPAERERVTRRATDNVRALLAYGMGLEAEGRGDFARAREYFSRALALDPRFAAARRHLDDAEAALEASRFPPEVLALLALRGGAQLPGSAGDLAAAEALVPPIEGRDAVAEVLGQEGVGPDGAVLRIHIRTGGGQ